LGQKGFNVATVQQSALPIEEGAATRFFVEFFNEYCNEQVMDLAQSYPDKRSLAIDFALLSKYKSELADALVEKPDIYLKAAEAAARQLDVFTPGGSEFAPHVRINNMSNESAYTIQNLGAEHLNKVVRVDGIVTLITQIMPKLQLARWICIHCTRSIDTPVGKTGVEKPSVCPGCGRGDGLYLSEQASGFVNMQRSQMQDPVENIKGNIPAPQVDLWLEDDLVNTLSPGDNVIITGILRLRQNQQSRGGKATPVYSKFFDVVGVEKQQKEFEELALTKDEEDQILEISRDPHLIDKVIMSIAPSIYGYSEMKEAIAVQLFGGTQFKVLPDGKKIRGDIHVLLVGDPGTAKSTILQYVKELAPKAIYVSGRGASGVGLTASAEKDEIADGGWVLKAGALVLASGGVVMVDEFDKMEPNDRASMHEAMEQQTISVAKAGIVTTFKSKTSVLAAANPKLGRFDPNTPPAQQFDIPPTLMSRFDLIFAIKDVLDEAKDRKLVDHVLTGHMFAAKKQKLSDIKDSPIIPPIMPDLLRKYISYARKNIHPVLSEEAANRIKEYYLSLRRMGAQQNTFPVTAREIEGLIRMSEASAKLRLSNTVELRDSERAIALVHFVLSDIFMDKETGKIDSDIISTGQPKSKVDKMRSVLGIINALEQKLDMVDIDDIVEQAVAIGMDENAARRLIDELKRNGDLYEPKVGFVKSSRGR